MTLKEQLAALDAVTRYCSPEFRALCAMRYIGGHAEYGDAWTDRNNVDEASPEAADIANYATMALLHNEQPLPVVQAAAKHAECAYLTLKEGKLTHGQIGLAIAKAHRKAAKAAPRDYEALALAGALTADDVKALRADWGLTQPQMGEALGVLKPDTVSAYENGRLRLSPAAQGRYLRAIQARKTAA
jgi:DNA-binding transcriptional regulator YiaG